MLSASMCPCSNIGYKSTWPNDIMAKQYSAIQIIQGRETNI